MKEQDLALNYKNKLIQSKDEREKALETDLELAEAQVQNANSQILELKNQAQINDQAVIDYLLNQDLEKVRGIVRSVGISIDSE